MKDKTDAGSRGTVPLLLLAALLSLAPRVALSATEGGETLVFQEDYARAVKQARQEGKAMVVEFETAWCPFCRAMERVTFQDPEVVEAARDLVLAKVDADSQTVLARKFRTGDAFPLFVFLDRNQKELFRLEGYHPPDSFRLALEAAADEGSALTRAVREAEASGKDPGAYLRLGDALYDVGALGAAAESYGKALKRGLEGEAAERAASRRAEHCREMGEWSEAEGLYARLLSSHASSERAPFYSLGLVKTYLGWGREAEARKTAAGLQATHPDHAASKTAARLVEDL